MCGIWCAFTKKCETAELINNYDLYFKPNIIRRGPNHHQTQEQTCGECNILFAASVLWLQGSQITKQPLISEKAIFLLNGDIFECDSIFEDNRKFIGDTKIFHDILETTMNIKDSVMRLKGPFAFIYLEKDTSRLYFGRDPIGRRSLLIGKNESRNCFVLTSVACKHSCYDFIELPALGIFSIDLKSFKIQLYPWNCKHENFADNIKMLESFLHLDIKFENVETTTISYQEPLQHEIFTFSNKNDCIAYIQHLLSQDLWNNNMIQLGNVLKEAVKKRIDNQPKKCKDCVSVDSGEACSHSYVGILFSGGLDCSVLAMIVEELIDANNPIDLINVSFDEKSGFNSPDRITALSTLTELKLLKPNRQWNFVSVNVTQEELNEWRSKRIADLIYPLNSILDDSLGCALWFASRASGDDGYKSPCRVLIVGMGADELLGGYSKHRRAFKQGGWSCLNDSLNVDWQNISVRNLARDDRVISDHGRQLRTPYLDENVVEFLRSLPNWQKMYLHDDVPQGIGDKILLRTLAYYLGFRQVVGYKKRALQFGSRIANSKENANAVSPRL